MTQYRFGLVAFDPGETTGFCHVEEKEAGRFIIRTIGLLRTITHMAEVLDSIRICADKRIDLILTEDFVGAGNWRANPMLIPPQRIGSIEMYCYIHQIMFEKETPGKRFYPVIGRIAGDTNLPKSNKAMELAERVLQPINNVRAKYKEHMLDATGHAIYYTSTRHTLTFPINSLQYTIEYNDKTDLVLL